jgi:hypothetical protein
LHGLDLEVAIDLLVPQQRAAFALRLLQLGVSGLELVDELRRVSRVVRAGKEGHGGQCAKRCGRKTGDFTGPGAVALALAPVSSLTGGQPLVEA